MVELRERDWHIDNPTKAIPEGLTPRLERWHFHKMHRSTWVCMVCFANIDAKFRKQHALWHAHSVHRRFEDIRPAPSELYHISHEQNKKDEHFTVEVAYCNGELWVHRVHLT